MAQVARESNTIDDIVPLGLQRRRRIEPLAARHNGKTY